MEMIRKWAGDDRGLVEKREILLTHIFQRSSPLTKSLKEAKENSAETEYETESSI